jgi:CBS domain-containing protein
VFRFERGLCPRKRVLGGRFGRGAEPPSELASALHKGDGAALSREHVNGGMRSPTSVGEVMRTREQIAVVGADAPVCRVVEVMVEAGVEGVLVVDGRGRVVGSIGDEQLVARANARQTRSWWRHFMDQDDDYWGVDDMGNLAAGEAMLKRVVSVSPALSLAFAIRLLDDHAVNVLPVVYGGRLVGAVFRSDLVKRLFRPFSGAAAT